MLERNIDKLLSAGFHDVTVAVSVRDPELEDYIQTRGRARAAARGARIECLRESQPLGTIGVVRELKGRADDVLVVNVDNLTSLDLRKFVAHHKQAGAALTIATHFEPFQIPFGEVRITDGRITTYLEKPVRHICISSGTYVLHHNACNLVPQGCRTDLPQLFALLVERGERVVAFEHNAYWIDVNDAAAVEKAEGLIREHFREFELWDQTPDREVVRLLLCSPQGVLLEPHSSTAARNSVLLDLPGEQITIGDNSPVDVALRLLQNYRRQLSAPTLLISFDELDVTAGQLVRYHVFHARTDEEWVPPSLERQEHWLSLAESEYSSALSSPLVRSLAALKGRL
jgi:dTDP-glucose pyrophosphorylase